MLQNYLRIAWRVMAKNRVYALISVLSLALGVCGCIVIWLVAHYELSFDRWRPDAARIYRVGNGGKQEERKNSDIIPPMPDEIRRTVFGVEAVTTFFTFQEGHPVIVPAAGKRQEVAISTAVEGQGGVGNYIIADEHWFKIFQYQWLVGDPGILRRPFTVVLTEKQATQYFGALPPESFLGRELIYEDSLHVRVGGIVRDWKGNTDVPYTSFISFASIEASFLKETRLMDDWVPHSGMGRWNWPHCFIKLGKGVRPEQVEARLKTIAQKVVGSNTIHPFQVLLQPLSAVHFDASYQGDGIHKAHLPTLYALMGIAIFILLLGTVNFINLSTAQSIKRAKEIGVRKVLGSGRRSIMAQFLTETGVITILAVGLAVLLVKPVMTYFSEYIPAGVHFQLWDPLTLLFLFGVTVITTILAGIYPAKVLAGYVPIVSLKGGGGPKGGEKWLLRRGLIVFQFVISLVFILVSMLMGNQIRYMLATDYGFKTEAILTVNARPSFWDTTGRMKLIANRFRELPGIAQIIPEGNPPIGWGAWSNRLEYKGRENVVQPMQVLAGDAGYIPFYGIRLLAGRNIRQTDSLAEWILNETAVRGFGFARPADAVGKMLYYGKLAYPIVGVVADFHEGSFKEPIKPTAIGHVTRFEWDLGIRLASAGKNPDHVQVLLKDMEKIFKEFYPNDRFVYRFMDQSIAELYETEQKTAALVRAVMVLAIFISCMGLFGLALFTASRKAAEISIRKVLGATTADIAALLNRGFVGLVLLSLVIASPLAWWLVDRWLRDFAYQAPIALWIFPLAGLGGVLLVLVTVSFQSIRAAMANPVKNLRSE